MRSKDLNEVEQVPLMLVRRPDRSPDDDVSLETIAKCKSLLAAINLMFNTSGIEDKELYSALGVDPGHFSHIRKGKAGVHFPTNKLNDAMNLCDSEIPLIWLALSRGKGLHLLESEKDRQLREEREKSAKLAERLHYLEELHTRRA